jgi:predicted transglutaminase-like cysteine proteinase
MTKFFLILVVSICMLLPTAASAKDHAPIGYQMMCLKNRDACVAVGSNSIAYNAQLLKNLMRVNNKVNAAMHPKRDAINNDQWSLNATAGDCEEYALAKRQKLIGMGYPSAALRIAYSPTYKGGHAVLVVSTTKGRFVLDILKPNVLPISSTPYGGWKVL